MLTSLGKLSTEAQEIRAQITKMAQDKVTPSLEEAFKELKVAIPRLQSIRWSQYTPYFNDGDACVFSVNEVYFAADGIEEKDGDYEDGYIDSWSLKDYDFTSTQIELLEHFVDDLNNIENLLEEAFGDHVQITLSAGGIETEAYEHD